jgi:2-aminoadipate transaminase
VAALQYGPTEGDDELRALAAARLGAAVAADVLVTTGSQQGLDLVARALVDPGDVVVVEAPSYLGALQALRTCEPAFVDVPLDRDGLCTDVLEERLVAGLRPKLLYTVPNFQNPSGTTLALGRRVHLAALADRYGFVVVEDDPYGVLRFRGDPLPPIRSFGENVVSLGTASKLLAPGLRVGWLAAPAWLLGPLVRLKQAADLHTSTLAQRIVADVLADAPFLAAHVEHVGALYRERCDALVDAVDGLVDVVRPDGGMFLWGRMHDGDLDTTALLAIAVERGVAFVPGPAFHVAGQGTDALRLSFSTLTPAELREAATRLGDAVADVATGGARVAAGV